MNDSKLMVIKLIFMLIITMDQYSFIIIINHEGK